MTIVPVKNLELHPIDLSTAFLHDDLKENIIMEQPECFIKKINSNHVRKFQRVLYGLDQAPKSWFEKIDTFFFDELQFLTCSYDLCLYFKQNNESIIIAAQYVNDLHFAAHSRDAVQEVEAKLSSLFEMMSCGEPKLCAGIENYRGRAVGQLKLSRKSHFIKVLERFSMSNGNLCQTTMKKQISNFNLDDKVYLAPPIAKELAVWFIWWYVPDPTLHLQWVGYLSSWKLQPMPCGLAWNKSSDICMEREIQELRCLVWRTMSLIQLWATATIIGQAASWTVDPRWDTYSKLPQKQFPGN